MDQSMLVSLIIDIVLVVSFVPLIVISNVIDEGEVMLIKASIRKKIHRK
jgi:hypothetical protein